MSEAALQLHTGDKGFTGDQIALIKSTVAKGTTNDELSLFLYTAKRTGLDPLMKQIHAIKRWSKKDNREVMTIQTGIDGLRLIAERTDRYAPGPDPVVEEKEGKVFRVTAYVKKFVAGEWHIVPGRARYDEFVQTDREGKPVGLWAKMPEHMTSKCAEALALRKAFPAEMSGVYTFDEMTQADSEPPVLAAPPVVKTVEAKVADPVGPSPAVEKQASPPPAEGEMDEHTMRDHLAMILSEIADLRNASTTPPGKFTAGDILIGYTANKDGKYGKSKLGDVAFTMDKRSGGTWSPLTAIYSKAKKDLEQMKKDADDEVAFG